MFRTRLNPTKPPAAHRAVLEHVGAGCREFRAAAEAGRIQPHNVDQAREILSRHRVFSVGVPVEFGGAGNQPLLVALAAERLGREGPTALFALLAHLPAAVTVAHRGTLEQKEQYLRAAAAGTGLSGATLREMESTAAESTAYDNASRHADESILPTDAVLTYRLARAAGSIGRLADCIEVLAEFTAARIQQEDVVEGNFPIDRFFAEAATDLEAARAITYAAAELKAEFDARPTSEHLKLEASTLVNEAYFFADKALDRMLARAAETPLDRDSRILDHLPPRHELTWPVEAILDEGPPSMENEIARYYLVL